jgi:hypothetical protein
MNTDKMPLHGQVIEVTKNESAVMATEDGSYHKTKESKSQRTELRKNLPVKQVAFDGKEGSENVTIS